jgi:hypothetical protein
MTSRASAAIKVDEDAVVTTGNKVEDGKELLLI